MFYVTMDKLPEALLVEILSRLNDSIDVARCHLASKSLHKASQNLRSISLECPFKWYLNSRSSSSRVSNFTPFKKIFLNLVSNLRVLDSVCIGVDHTLLLQKDVSNDGVLGDDLYLIDEDFVMQWLPRVSGFLRSLSICNFPLQARNRLSNVLQLVSVYCCNLVELEVKNAWLSAENLNPMPMLNSLTLECVRFDDNDLNKLNMCFPNLQVLNLIGVSGPKQLTIYLHNLKTCHLSVSYAPSSLSLITPNLITLRLECIRTAALNIEAPMLSHFHLTLDLAATFTFKKFENLKTLWLETSFIGSLLHKFQLTEAVEKLTLDSRKGEKGVVGNSSFNLENVFTVFPNLSSLCIKSYAWSELEVCYNPLGWNWDGKKGFKKLGAYLWLVNPSMTFSFVANVLDQCIGLSEVSFLIHHDIVSSVSKSFISRCMARWPALNWRWGMWRKGMEDSWMTDINLKTVCSKSRAADEVTSTGCTFIGEYKSNQLGVKSLKEISSNGDICDQSKPMDEVAFSLNYGSPSE